MIIEWFGNGEAVSPLLRGDVIISWERRHVGLEGGRSTLMEGLCQITWPIQSRRSTPT